MCCPKAEKDRKCYQTIITHDEIKDDTKLKTIREILLGVALAFTSGFLFIVSRAIIEALNLNSADVLFSRYILQTAVCFTAIMCLNYRAIKSGQNENQLKWWVTHTDDGKMIHSIRALLFFQGISNGVYQLAQIVSVLLMPLGDSTALIFTAPLSTMILSKIFLKTQLKL